MGRSGALNLNRSRSWRGGCGRPALARGRSARGGCPCPVQRSPGSGDDRACGGDRRRWPDRAAVGGRAGVGGDRCRRRRRGRRGCEVVGFAQDDAGVDVELSGDTSLRAEYLVGCDGGRSLIRKAAGIDFPGWDPTSSYLIAEVEMGEEPPVGMRPEGGGIGPVNREKGGGPYGVVLLEKEVEHATEPTMTDLSEALIAAYGTDYGVHSPTWISRFTDMTRQAASYREGRVLLAGDAAHIHGPQGGQGLNDGVQDAVHLGCKLAQVVNKTSPESLLVTYYA